jgi:hypothetical protein
MSMTINVGLSRKLGTPNYGSRGASCAVEFQVESGLQPGDLEAFQRQVRNAYAACRDAIQQELARQQAETSGNGTPGGPAEAVTPGPLGPALSAASPNGNGHHGNGHRGGQGNGQAASDKQLGYLRQLATQVSGLGIRRLETLAQQRYGTPVVALTSVDASGLIDTLKRVKAGELDLAAVLEGAVP